MKRPAALALMLLGLAACGEDEHAAPPPPATMTAEAVGHYCQMNLLEHPGPKAQVHLADVLYPVFFSQVRDAIAYQRLPEQSHVVVAIYVSDMAQAPSWDDPGADNWVAADAAHYVVGSDRAGGMGAGELVPFSDAAAATAFAAAHGGEVLRLAAIPDDLVLAPVAFEAEFGVDDDADYADRLRALADRPHGNAP